MQICQHAFTGDTHFSAEPVRRFHNHIEEKPPPPGSQLTFLLFQFCNRILNPAAGLRADMCSPVHHAVNRGSAEACLKGDFLDREAMGHLMDS